MEVEVVPPHCTLNVVVRTGKQGGQKAKFCLFEGGIENGENDTADMDRDDMNIDYDAVDSDVIDDV